MNRSFGMAALGAGAGEPTSLVMIANDSHDRRNASQHSMSAYGRLCLAIQFVRWVDGRRKLPGPEEVMNRFDCSKATAYRWLAAYTAEKRLAA